MFYRLPISCPTNSQTSGLLRVPGSSRLAWILGDWRIAVRGKAIWILVTPGKWVLACFLFLVPRNAWYNFSAFRGRHSKVERAVGTRDPASSTRTLAPQSLRTAGTLPWLSTCPAVLAPVHLTCGEVSCSCPFLRRNCGHVHTFQIGFQMEIVDKCMQLRK